MKNILKSLAISFLLLTPSLLLADPKSTPTPVLSEVDNLLSQAASQFQSPDAPKAIHVLDESQAVWSMDKTLKITVHQIWATRLKTLVFRPCRSMI